jgi:hypothetical protein
MTPFQNDPQPHKHEAKQRKHRVLRTPDPSPDSDSVRKGLHKSGIGSNFGPQTFDFTVTPVANSRKEQLRIWMHVLAATHS